MDKLPREILVHVLRFSEEPSATKNCRSTCKTLYQLLMAEKSQFIIKALPVNALESLSAMLNRSTKKIELIVRAPTLAVQRVPNKFMNGLTSLTNLTGLDILEWRNLPRAALMKLLQMTNLERLSMNQSDVNLSPLYNISQLELHRIPVFPKMPLPFTNLQDLTAKPISPDLVEGLSGFSKLTRLHLGCDWGNDVPVTIFNLVAMSKLKDLNISSVQDYRLPKIKLIASCTTLEALDIDLHVEEVDVDWISSNTQLTRFHVRCDYSDPVKFHPLTRLQNISSARFIHENTASLLGNCRLKKLDLDFYFSHHANLHGCITCTTIESLKCRSYPSHLSTSLSNLTELICYNHFPDPPTSLKVLRADREPSNILQMTRLEVLSYSSLVDDTLQFEAQKFTHLTRIEVTLNTERSFLALKSLSNALSLKELYISVKEKYDWSHLRAQTYFLTTLTNLEVLYTWSFHIPLAVFDSIVDSHTKLTRLRVNCSESTGSNLTRLTNLQELVFYSARPMKGLKMILEEKLPRLSADIQV